MFDRKKFKSIILEKDNMTWEDIEDQFRMRKLWREMIDLIIGTEAGFNDFILYMRTEMTENEYSYLSEISDDISQEKPSYEFIDAYKFLAEKYPEETKKYGIVDWTYVNIVDTKSFVFMH